MITVVIPYFQRSAGILRKALASVGAQLPAGMPVHVIVVDDASPVPAASEVANTEQVPAYSLEIITQTNSGPGAARNTGLDRVPAGTRYIAFLDSDDEWSEDHLARALEALESGFDFFFADHLQLGQTTGAFARASRLRMIDHAPLRTTGQHLYAYQGDMFDQILRGNVVGTSTVVFRYEGFSELRFAVEFTTAGEDYLFWMSLSKATARVTFSTQVEAVYGKGVNVFSGSGWGTEGHLLRVHQEICYRKAVSKLFQLNGVQKQHVQAELKRLRNAFARDFFHRLRARKPLPKGLLRAHADKDPLTFVALPLALFDISLARKRNSL